MTCRDAAASLDDFVDGSLPPARRQALANHVRECSTCARALKEAGCARRLLRRLPRERMPDPMKTELLDALRRSRSAPDSRLTPRSHTAPDPTRSQPADDDPRSSPIDN